MTCRIMKIDWNDNKLTDQIKAKLKQGTRVKFMWHGSSTYLYTGRIEVDKFGRLFFVNEHNYEEDLLIHEGMRWYNPLESFWHFTMFEIIEN